ncbi:MAG: undecaprenyl-diphosphate phosphatase [Candidatus Fimivivens sp.]
MTVTEAIIQGIIQGLTEFLPVSSSGHLALYQYFTGQSGESGALFSVVLHLGTLIAVFVAFWGTIKALIVEFFNMVGDLFHGKLSFKRVNPQRKMIFLLIVSLLPLFITLLLKDILRGVAQDNSIFIEGLCFLVTSSLLLMADSCTGRTTAQGMPYRTAATIGLVQAFAPLPGISRSGSTLSASMMLGLERNFAVNFSFIMGIPAVCAALLLDAKEIVGGGLNLPTSVILIGLAFSTVFGLLAIGMIRWLVAAHKLRWFGYYTLVLGIFVVGAGVYDAISGHALQNIVITLLK